MYQAYKDVAEFRMIYIKEAHAIDSTAPHESAREKGILNHKNTKQRCATAKMLIDDESLTIPTLIDSMNDAVNHAYRAHPDRIFVVRTDGRLGTAAMPGPAGFEEGIKDAKAWLSEFKNSGVEPEIPAELLEAALTKEKEAASKQENETPKKNS